MRAGRLDRTIAIQSVATAVGEDGTPTETWSTFAYVRAEILEGAAQEAERDYGDVRNTAMTLRIRWRFGVSVAHRVVFEGRKLNIREVKEIGRRRGLELRCEEIRP